MTTAAVFDDARPVQRRPGSRHRALMAEYDAAVEAWELEAERVTYGYGTELEEYAELHPRPTFKVWLMARGGERDYWQERDRQEALAEAEQRAADELAAQRERAWLAAREPAEQPEPAARCLDDVSRRPYRSVMTSTRTFRVPEKVWQRAKAATTDRGDTVSEVIRTALADYARGAMKLPDAEVMARRGIRIPDEVWQAAMTAAERNGQLVSDVIRTALERYVETST